MRVLDCHIHVESADVRRPAFHEDLERAGVSGGVVLSLPPAGYCPIDTDQSAPARLDNLFAWVDGHAGLYPFFWVDPTEPNAADDVDTALSCGIAGFKVICNHFFPGDERAIDVYRAIARSDKPILFHSGILWDGTPSSRFNRPAEFEALLEIDRLRFALAHISWPWCDECIAVYGKFLDAKSARPGEDHSEMFIDLTPGTPPIYRRDALTKLFTVGYDVAHNILFGSDRLTHSYDPAGAARGIASDEALLIDIGLDDDARQLVFADNLERFITG